MRAEIKRAIKDVAYPEVVEALQAYEIEGKPFAWPTFKPQDRSSKKQRAGDLLGGFPFTSEAYPWPTEGVDGLHMQPIAQIDLKKASQLLEFDFGEGLLQVWGVVGMDKESFDVLDIAFSSDYSKGVFLRIIPAVEARKTATDFFPDFAPWLDQSETKSEQKGILFIEPNESMSVGSVISWKLSNELMYPIPHYSIHGIESFVPKPIQKSDVIDPYDLFLELEAAVRSYLQCPVIDIGCCLGGVRSYGEGRDSDPANNFPLLINIGGEINISVIFDDTKFLRPEYSSNGSSIIVHFAREKMLRVVFYYVG